MASLIQNPALTNLFGSLDAKLRTRLSLVLENPAKHWDDAYSIIVRGEKMMTLWQAVVAVDPTFPKSGPVSDAKGNVISGWARYPDQVTIARALKYAGGAK